MAALVIFDFDGTLFDTHESIEQSIKLTFDALLPSHALAPSEVHRLISSGAGLSDTFQALHPNAATFTVAEEERWVNKYREIYATDGQLLIKAFPGAKETLDELNTRKIPVAIISNKGVAAVKTALERNGMAGYVPENLIIGDKTPGAQRKPSPASFVDVLAPTLQTQYGLAGLEPRRVLVVGDTVADIQFAKNIGGRACWCRYGYGDKDACEKLQPDFIADSLNEVVAMLGQQPFLA
ncbi:phosphoglycolate phosphatase 1 [Nannizzia gypsea CBS 118893]|uniref:Phosphoglycolate phosphatase 1 n=1 Tax=Arthroderma gypseum (strain ATCC MYA-4604 / CBS 118893) TaxID=535722 RepID=E4UN65_ARTGP|nr:phosphoglycolate phosphatase 1 [Nannizzia gypsea CBS 118893]EFR00367.1 phosphoglycolate phosphatase 1 [Nannizzia gypsea CBS 118893]